MDAAVLWAATTADRDGGRLPGQIERKLPLERLAKLVTVQLTEKLAERRSVGQLAGRKAPALGDVGIVQVDFRQGLNRDKSGNHKILKRLPDEGNCFQSFEIEIAQTYPPDTKHGDPRRAAMRQ